ncbi:hypothetical protein MW887_001196 [Aspergillus wentii]|nr:hypothetical protein MW887_001196 [Aspergillus wentii]
MLFSLILFFYNLDFYQQPTHESHQTHIDRPVVESPLEARPLRVSPPHTDAQDKQNKHTTTPSTSTHTDTSTGKLTSDDVALLFKTGASVLWRRLPIHLSTTFSPARIHPNNTILYSDYPETIGSWHIIDILANSSSTVRQSDSFQPYLQQEDYENRQVYAESTSTNGDGNGPLGGWKLDKYKFLPLIQHAGVEKPNAKWYIYMEDDSYIFLPNLLRHLNDFNYRDPWYLGSLAWKHGDYFAHGGAGFALSRGAWEKSFGKDPNIIDKFEQFTDVHGCGDHVLGHVLNEYGVSFGETHGDSRFTFGFNAEPHWSSWFTKANWCKPVYSWHHTHSKDVARFYNLESSWDFQKSALKYRDIYNAFIKPYLRHRVEWWDNQSSQYDITSSNAPHAEPPTTATSKETWLKSWQSADACEAACLSWSECVQWAFYEDRCRMHDQVYLGSGYPIGDPRRQTSLMYTSGWLSERMDEWACDE